MGPVNSGFYREDLFRKYQRIYRNDLFLKGNLQKAVKVFIWKNRFKDLTTIRNVFKAIDGLS